LLVGCASTQEQATTAGPAGSPLKTSGKAAGPQTGKPALDMAHIQDLKRQILAGQPAAH